ncbi:putative amp-CoA ligase [Mycena crocata]|nr:putative amp-CoA ligase [Mycena crocata]
MSTTFRELKQHLAWCTTHWRDILAAASLTQGDVVGLWLTGQKYDDAVNIMGVSAAGYVPQMFSSWYSNPNVIWDLLAATKAKALIFDDSFASACATAPVLTIPTLSFNHVVHIDSGAPEIAAVTAQQTALIVHSSGTTSGAPKVIPLTHGWVRAFIKFKFPGSLKQGDFGEGDVTNTIGSLAHVGSFTAFVAAAFHGFCTVQLSSGVVTPADLVDMIRNCGLNRIAIYAPSRSNHIRAAQSDPGVLAGLRSCRQILHTGGALNKEDENWAYEHDLPLTVMYGTSETAPIMTSVLGTNPSDRLLRILDGSSAKLVTHAPQDSSESLQLWEVVLPAGEPDSPHPSLFGNENLYHTGDLFEEVEEGLYIFRGRTGDWLRMQIGFCDTKSIEDNVRKTCAGIVHDVVVLGSNRARPILFVETAAEVPGESASTELKQEIIRRTELFNQRLFQHEHIQSPNQIRLLEKGTLPRTKEKGNIRRNAAEQLYADVLDGMCN